MSSVVTLTVGAPRGIPVADIVAKARRAVTEPVTTATLAWCLAEYLDLARPEFIPKDPQLYPAAQQRLEHFVTQHILDPQLADFWGRADCLSRLYRKTLRAEEYHINHLCPTANQ